MSIGGFTVAQAIEGMRRLAVAGVSVRAFPGMHESQSPEEDESR